jgi:hypothetical protein
MREMNRNPEAEAAAKRMQMNAELQYKPEEKAKFDANQAAIEAFDKAQFDPEKQRKDRLNAFLTNATGVYGHEALASGARASTGLEQAQTAAERGAMVSRQGKLEGLLEAGRKSREESAKIGEKTSEQANMGIRQGIASSASMVDKDKEMANAGLDRASREKIANIQANVQREINQASKEGTLELKRQTFMLALEKAESSAIALARKGPDADLLKNLAAFEAAGELTDAQKATKKAAQARQDLAEKAAIIGYADLRAQVMSENSAAGLGSLSQGAFKVTPIKK